MSEKENIIRDLKTKIEQIKKEILDSENIIGLLLDEYQKFSEEEQ